MGHRWASTAGALRGAAPRVPPEARSHCCLGTVCSTPGAFYLDWNVFRKLESLSAFKHWEISARNFNS